ncbi:MAG: alpha/beta fold hydrolase [Candidatus Accumulibacter sp.]|jgi:pimeloyl-[acyl-carrier protein] methyl ester esterase|nr:alpha/beta fold hydrolase [Accumulibacter sp.]
MISSAPMPASVLPRRIPPSSAAEERLPPKPDVVLIHGWGFDQTIWTPLADSLSKMFTIRLAALPGYAPAKPASTGFDETARRLADETPEGAILCGWSLGGLIALRAAIRFPRRFGGLVLIGTTPRFTCGTGWAHAQPLELLESFTESVKNDPAGTLQRFNALLNRGDTRARNALRALSSTLTSIPDATSLFQGLEWLRDVDLRPEIASIEIPVRLIHGDKDPLMPLQAAQWMEANLRNARLKTVFGAAHAPFINDPESVVHQIAELSNSLHASSSDCETARPRVV